MQMKKWAAITAIGATLVAGCGTPSAAPASPEPDGVTVLGASVERVRPAVTDDEVAALTDAQTSFALDLYHAVREEVDDDLVLGPGSLHTVLAMLRAGARGATGTEMDAVLHADGVDLHATGNALDRALADRDRADGIEFATGNRLWVQDAFQLTDEYVDTIAGNYGAALAAADFVGDPEASRRAINDWVAGATRDRIDELFPVGVLDRSTRLVLTNAVFLDAQWRFPFEPQRTSGEPFLLADGTQIEVPTMHYDEYLPAAVTEDWSAVELPYADEELTMTVIVPRDLAEFEQHLDAAMLAGILDSIRDGGIHLSLPRFTARSHLSLAETLSAMGMPSAFAGGADFSGMTGRPDLFIQAVEHEAVIDVDEAGTKAAAASGGAMAGSHGPTVTVDRPFLFLVRDEPTGAMLFLGRVTDPRDTED
jgi:serpin B